MLRRLTIILEVQRLRKQQQGMETCSDQIVFYIEFPHV